MVFTLPLNSINSASTGQTYLSGQMIKSSPNSAVDGSTALFEINGNIGIGTSSPSTKLDVSGNVVISGKSTFQGIADIKTYTETESSPSISGNTLSLDLSAAGVFDVNLNANITTMTISNVPPSSGKVSGFTLILTADGTPRTVSWPLSFRWPGGSPPTITSTNNKRDIFTFFSTDNGTSWNAFISGQNI